MLSGCILCDKCVIVVNVFVCGVLSGVLSGQRCLWYFECSCLSLEMATSTLRRSASSSGWALFNTFVDEIVRTDAPQLSSRISQLT